MQPEDTAVLTRDQITATASTIVEQQCHDGMILWFSDGHADTWNHTEAAMALSAAGFLDAAGRAYEWLAKTNFQTEVGITTTWPMVSRTRKSTRIVVLTARPAFGITT